MPLRIPDLRRSIKAAHAAVEKEIEGNATGLYGRGLSGEGYAGGYRQALSDLLLLLEGHVLPNTRVYWSNVEPFGVRRTCQAFNARINSVLTKVQEEMTGHGDGKYARGLSSEGYAGGYAQALRDCSLLACGHALPSTRNYWEEPSVTTAAPE